MSLTLLAPLSLSTDGLRHTLATLSPLDWALLAVALWTTVRGFLRGVILELFGLIAVLGGLLVASWNYPLVALWLSRWIATPPAASTVAFLLLVVATVLVVLGIARLARSAVRLAGLGLLDRIAGALFALTRTALLLSAILTGLAAFLPPQPILRSSRLVPPLLELAHTASLLAPADLRHRLTIALTHLYPSRH